MSYCVTAPQCVVPTLSETAAHSCLTALLYVMTAYSAAVARCITDAQCVTAVHYELYGISACNGHFLLNNRSLFTAPYFMQQRSLLRPLTVLLPLIV